MCVHSVCLWLGLAPQLELAKAVAASGWWGTSRGWCLPTPAALSRALAAPAAHPGMHATQHCALKSTAIALQELAACVPCGAAALRCVVVPQAARWLTACPPRRWTYFALSWMMRFHDWRRKAFASVCATDYRGKGRGEHNGRGVPLPSRVALLLLTHRQWACGFGSSGQHPCVCLALHGEHHDSTQWLSAMNHRSVYSSHNPYNVRKARRTCSLALQFKARHRQYNLCHKSTPTRTRQSRADGRHDT